jgi:hypothetical protein
MQAFCILYNILVNIQEQDPKENLEKGELNENDIIKPDNQTR